MRLINLFERASSVLYHFTNVVAACKILESGKFELSSVFGSIEHKYAPEGYPYFLSCTRTLTGGYHSTVGGSGVMFNLSGDFFNARYKAYSVDYWGNRSPQQGYGIREHEAEDRIFSKTPTIPAGGITEIHIYQEPMDDQSKKWAAELPGRIRKLLILAKSKGIPTYYYQDIKAWRLQNKTKATPISKEDFSLRGEYASITGSRGYMTTYLSHWLELIYKNKTADLSKKAASSAYSIAYDNDYWLESTRQSLENDFANARKPSSGIDREIAIKMISWMQKNGIKSIKQLVDVLKEKWKKIKERENVKLKPVDEDDEIPRIKLRGFNGIPPSKKFVDKMYAEYPHNPFNNKEFGIVYDQEHVAFFELKPSMTNPNAAYISFMHTHPQREGVGRKALGDLQKMAAENNIGLELFPWDKGNVSKAALTRFYKSMGFVGKNNSGSLLIWNPPSESINEEDVLQPENRLAVKIKELDHRVSFNGFAKSDSWMKPSKLVAEAICEIRDDNTCFIGFLQSFEKGKGFATELVKYIIEYYKNKNITNFKAYINHMNENSKNVFRKLGFSESEVQRNGSFWTLDESN